MKQTARKHPVPRPFLKWVGGKGQLLGDLMPHLERAQPFGRYHEPFVGGGALFFAAYRGGSLPRKQAFLSDNNKRLIDAYQGVKEYVEQVIELLHDHKERHCHDHYYAVRAQVPEDVAGRAARIIYLNRTCFNGLFRENSKGLFNVPIGKYKNPMICDEENLRAVSEALGKARVESRPFEAVLDSAKTGDFVYFDPPYHPVSDTANFTSYDKAGFGETEQRRLAEVFAELDQRSVKALLSNSYTPLVRELYKGFRVGRVSARRAVNSRADRRGAVSEALVRNF